LPPAFHSPFSLADSWTGKMSGWTAHLFFNSSDWFDWDRYRQSAAAVAVANAAVLTITLQR
jgi:hypothetical protein